MVGFITVRTFVDFENLQLLSHFRSSIIGES